RSLAFARWPLKSCGYILLRASLPSRTLRAQLQGPACAETFALSSLLGFVWPLASASLFCQSWNRQAPSRFSKRVVIVEPNRLSQLLCCWVRQLCRFLFVSRFFVFPLSNVF